MDDRSNMADEWNAAVRTQTTVIRECSVVKTND